jgi:hypothetical protein
VTMTRSMKTMPFQAVADSKAADGAAVASLPPVQLGIVRSAAPGSHSIIWTSSWLLCSNDTTSSLVLFVMSYGSVTV